MKRLLAAVVLAAVLAGTAAAATPGPKTPKQALTIVQAILDKNKTTACALVWTHLSAIGLDMMGPPFRVTGTVTTSKGNGAAIWLLNGAKTTPQNALARAIASGCK
jgi:opacity protein-like surface antigen